MKEVTLELTNLLIKRLSEKTPLIQVIQGPRQVGKTTALRQFYQLIHKKIPIHFVSGDGISSPIWIYEQWQIAKENYQILIIDEVQKIPNWSEMIKKLWDESKKKKEKIKCILTGSSSLSLQVGLTETLTGRFEMIAAYHWGFDLTLKLKKISLEKYMIYGGYPGSYQFINDQKRWVNYMTSSIVETVIGKDILTQATVKNPALFRQAFYIISSYPAQVISYNKILGQLQERGNIDLVKHYIELYESAYLIKTISKFSSNELKRKSSSPKIIVMAPSLSTFHRIDLLKEEDFGRVFESMIGAEFVRQGFEISYWSEGNYEVDYILNYKNKLIAFEVKSGRKKTSTSLDVFMKKYPSANLIYITKDNFTIFSRDIRAFLDRHL